MTAALITAEGLMARLDYRVRRTWRQAGLEDEGWSNITRHCVAVAAAAMVMAEKMLLPADELDLAVDAALVHDAFKKQEVEAKRAAEAAGEDVAEVLAQMAYRQGEFLIVCGWPLEIVRVAQSSGHTSLYEFLHRAKFISAAQEVLHVADDLVDGESFPGLAPRVAGLPTRYAELAAMKTSEFGLPDRPDWNVFDYQLAVSQALLAKFAKQAGLVSPEEFEALANAQAAELFSILDEQGFIPSLTQAA